MYLFLISFLLIILLIIYKPAKFTEGGIALLGMFTLLTLTLLSWNEIPQALLGNDFLQPFQIVLILIGLAVISTTLDDFGFFKYLAYKTILWSKNNGKVLFRNFFILTIIVTTFTSNDVDVLTITPIILWFSLITKINPWPYLFSVFVVANTSSMEFLIGNLTNIVIGSVFDIGFYEFFIVMLLPMIATLTGQYIFLRIIFRKQLPEVLLKPKELKKVEKRIDQPLPNKRQNALLLFALAFVIIGGFISDFFPVQLWMITSLGALFILLSNEFNVWERLRVIPWDVVMFVLVFIILTNKLVNDGVVEGLAMYFSDYISTAWSSIYFTGFFSAIFSGIINNIPASISLSTVFQSLTLESSEAVRKSVAFGLVVGTNLGALFTPVGALATILWINVVRKKGFNISIKKFVVLGLATGIISVFIASTVIGLEFMIFN